MKPLYCPACRSDIVPPAMTSGLQPLACPSCGDQLEVEVFPALSRAPQAGAAGQPATEGEAVCFVHGERRAERACDLCGRFMCALCDLHVGSMHLCPTCFEAGRQGRRLAHLERERMIFPAIAVRLVVGGFFLGPFAPALCVPAVCLAVWGLIKPTSVTGSRYIGSASVAIVVGLLLSILWATFWIR